MFIIAQSTGTPPAIVQMSFITAKTLAESLKVYEYPCLKYSEKNKIINRHISWAEFPEMQNRIELRDRIIAQIKSYQDRIRYIDKILGISRNKKIPT
ncbi:MAG: hypothetical protein NTY51_09605 [Deltaproteobacteria bacterium]|nr:hypothetical protein [Deltaproteobacteria bacterium]